jgi:beta-galactosidase
MKKHFAYLLLVAMACLLSCTSESGLPSPRERLSFNADWRFTLGDDSTAVLPTYNDSAWCVLNLPHDWAIEGDFAEDNPSGPGGGALPGGIGWYRKTFFADPADKGKCLYLDFDGVYMNSSVYLNGQLLGTRPYGYISFRYNLTPYIQWGQENVVAVRVDNSDQPNSRWYSGCGIYRNVWLTKCQPIHVAQWGTYATTHQQNGRQMVSLNVTVENHQAQTAEEALLAVRVTLLDSEGKRVQQVESETFSLKPGDQTERTVEMEVKKPHLWDVDDPYLYTLRTEVMDARTGEATDAEDTPLGIRTFRFDAELGFKLNRRAMKINGVCLHHDLGCLGSAINTRAIQRQLEMLKEMGCNAIRTSHNPPAPELLDLCDRMGFIVMDEAFDMWHRRKTQNDYARFFDEWHMRDLQDMVRRDRNHPCILMWSIGNEVLEQWSSAEADTLTLEQANMVLNFGHDLEEQRAEKGESMNSRLTRHLVGLVKGLDNTRPVTAGCNEPDPSNHLFRSGALDIIGFNYHEENFADVPQVYPGKPFLVTESVSALQTRGFYRMPSDSIFISPVRWDIPYTDESNACSAYDNQHAPWSCTHEYMQQMAKKYDYLCGQFIWTGFDYLGEPTPYGWPARSSFFGIIDLAGFPKDIYYMYQSIWRPDVNVLHLFPHWNWQPGQTVDMWAYYNNADEVELFINGKSQGVRQKGEDDFHVMWRVPFEPGTVKAVSRRGGKVVCEQEIHTAGAPAQLRLTPDRSELQADGTDLSFLTVDVLDKDGNLCPDADNDVQFAVEGEAFIAGVDNGSPMSLERFKANHRKAFHGKCLVVVQNKGQQGRIVVKATSAGLKAAEAVLTVK